MVDFGIKLKTLRVNRKLTQAQLATQLGLTKSVISAYENDIRMPSYEVLLSLARFFHVSTDFLLGVENKNLVDLSGLSDSEIKAIIKLIDAMKSKYRPTFLEYKNNS